MDLIITDPLSACILMNNQYPIREEGVAVSQSLVFNVQHHGQGIGVTLIFPLDGSIYSHIGRLTLC